MTNNAQLHELGSWLSKASPIHFIGAGGSGMRPLAEFTASFGVAVTGSDRSVPGQKSQILFAAEGTPKEKELIERANTIVFSSAISDDHPSLALSRTLGKSTLHRSELLAIFTRHHQTITVAGTHGKSTTSALVAHCLKALGSDPSWIIGAPFSDGQDSWRKGASPVLVIEADESDGSFLRYTSSVSVLNNIEPDHMDYYQTVGRLQGAFRQYMTQTSPLGGICFCGDMPNVTDAASGFGGRRISFGFSASNKVKLESFEADGLTTRGVILCEGRSIRFSLPLPGRHNLLNAMASLSVAIILGHDIEKAAQSLSTFPGVQRRLQRYPAAGPALIFDDYAHNPGKISSCLAGLAAAFPERSLIAVFQPHRYTRISSLYEEFIASFRGLNVRVVVLPVYAAGEASLPGYDPATIAKDIERVSGVKSFYAPTLKDGCDLVKSFLNPEKDIVVTVGAGDVWRIAKELSQRL